MIEHGRSGKRYVTVTRINRRHAGASGSTLKIVNIVLWVLQIAAAGIVPDVGS